MYLFYADVFFLLQEIGNLFSLGSVARWCAHPRRVKRSVIVSVFISGMETAMVLNMPYRWFNLLVHLLLIPLSVWLRFRKDVSGLLVKEWTATYMATMLQYGGNQFLTNIFGWESIPSTLLVACMVYFSATGAGVLRSKQKNQFRVRVRYKEITLEGTGFFDSGNLLYDPILKEPVTLADKKFLSPILAIYDKPVYPVCYETVAGKGTMETIKLSELEVWHGGQWHTYPNPRIGVVTHWTFDNKACQFLLHTEHT